MRPVQSNDKSYVKDKLADFIETDLLPAMRGVYAKADISTDIIGEVTGLDPLPENAARDLIASLVGANHADVVPFGTEAGLFQTLGADVVICGPGSISQAHKANEFVAIDQLRSCCDMLDKLARRLSV